MQESDAEMVRVTDTAALLSGLKGSTVYLISVRAQNSAGAGPSSPAVNVTTKKPREYSLRWNSCYKQFEHFSLYKFAFTYMKPAYPAEVHMNGIVVVCSSIQYNFNGFRASVNTLHQQHC